MDAVEAATYIQWYGTQDNCLKADEEKFRKAVQIVRTAPAIMTVAKGYSGPMEIVAVVGDLVAYRDERDDVGWGCNFSRWEIGGLFQKVADYVLAEGSPSQYIRGLYWGGALALTSRDAENLGIKAEGQRSDPPQIAAVFGSNVTYL